ncbi:MAG: transporter substrate-binding domain-containing protein [Burkholderiales bacterium]|nr:transporter substrate-binding domain-containing protein [Burkholderiales bacterium]
MTNHFTETNTPVPPVRAAHHAPDLARRALALALGSVVAVGMPALAQTELVDLAKIRASGVLKVAVYKANPPFSDGVGADQAGLDVSIAGALAKELGLRLALLPFDAGENMGDDLRNMVWRGHYLGYGPADVMLHVPVDKHLMAENRQVLILAPYMRQVLMVLHDTRKVADVRSPDDLKGLPLAAERGSGAASVLMGYGGGLLRDQVSILETGVAAAEAVASGKAAAAYVTRAQAEAVVSLQKGDTHLQLTPMQLPGLPGSGWPIGMAIKNQNKELGQAIEAAMQALRSRGDLQALFRQHGLTLTAP